MYQTCLQVVNPKLPRALGRQSSLPLPYEGGHPPPLPWRPAEAFPESGGPQLPPVLDSRTATRARPEPNLSRGTWALPASVQRLAPTWERSLGDWTVGAGVQSVRPGREEAVELGTLPQSSGSPACWVGCLGCS